MVPARMELWFTEMSALGSGLVDIPRYVPGVVGQSLTFSKLFTKTGDFKAAIIKYPLHTPANSKMHNANVPTGTAVPRVKKIYVHQWRGRRPSISLPHLHRPDHR